MKIITANNKKFVRLTRQEWSAIGQRAGWMPGIKEAGIFSDYWKGLKSVRNIRSQKGANRQAYWNAFESIPQIGKGLAQYQQNLQRDIQLFQNLKREGELFQIYPDAGQSFVDRVQKMVNNLSPVGLQILNQAIQSNGGPGNELILQDLLPICTQAIQTSEQMIKQSRTQGLEFSSPEFNQTADQIVDTVLSLPEPKQLQIIKSILNKNPELKQQIQSPIPHQSPVPEQDSYSAPWSQIAKNLAPISKIAQ